MQKKRALFSLLGLSLTAACVTPHPPAAGLTGLDQFQASCTNEPAALTDAQANAYAAALDAAMALPTPQARLAALKANVLEPLMQRALVLRQCGLYERTRADGILALAARYNQILAANHGGE